MKRIGVGIVGCGRISDLHELGYRNQPDAEILAVCDTNRKRARAQADRWGVNQVYSDYSELLKDPHIDLVELLVPHHLHCPFTIQAAKAGKHISVQKPMALSTSEADQMIEAAQESGVVLRIYENFALYEPVRRAKAMIESGEIGQPVMLRMHINTGTSPKGWKIPLSAWLWRFNEKKSGGGELVFDHGYHLFSVAYHLMGQASRVSAWIDRTPVAPGVYVDAPATIMMQFKAESAYGVFDIAHTPEIVMNSRYYSDDDRLEVVGKKGNLLINRYTTKTLDLPELMLYKDGETRAIPVERTTWAESFIDTTQHLVQVLQHGGQPQLDGETGKAVLQLTLSAQISARENREVDPETV